MKELSLEKIENIQGGDIVDVADGACAAVGVASYVGWAVPGLNVLVGTCAVYAVARVTGVI